MKKYGNSFHSGSKSYAAGKVPIWLHVDEFYTAGCTLNGQLEDSVIPVGTPVYVPKVGGEAVVLETFEVVGAVTAEGTSLVLKSVSGAVVPRKDLIVGKINASTGVASKAAKLPAVTSVGTGDHAGEITFTITANTYGALSDGDILYMISEAGSNKQMLYPTGLLYEDVEIGNEGATGTVVTKGQVLANRIAAVPAVFKPYLTNITFVNE